MSTAGYLWFGMPWGPAYYPGSIHLLVVTLLMPSSLWKHNLHLLPGPVGIKLGDYHPGESDQIL